LTPVPSLPVRFGLVGAGRWGRIHRDAIHEVGAELVAILVQTPDTADLVTREWGVPAFTAMGSFLEASFEAAIVASPNYLHGEHTKVLLAGQRHVLVEKPMALNVEECQKMIAIAEEEQRLLGIGLSMRRFTLFERIKNLIDEGCIGVPLHLKIDLWRRPYRLGAGGWKLDPDKVGSTVLEEAIHYLDLARWYLIGHHSEPKTVQAWANSRVGQEGLLQNLDVRLEFSGASALVTRSIAAYGHSVMVTLVGGKGSLHASWQGISDVDREPKVALTLDNESGTEKLNVEPRTGHAFDIPRQTANFVSAIREGTALSASGVDGLEAVSLSLNVVNSLKSGSIPVALRPST
jgi:predicted dehydrogenase